eukprot:1160258-Pelagomonas_calceolata.AAC.2
MLKTPQATLCLMVLHLTAVHEPKVMDEEIFAPEASLTTAEVATMDQNLKQWVRTWDLEAEAELSHLEETPQLAFEFSSRVLPTLLIRSFPSRNFRHHASHKNSQSDLNDRTIGNI